MWLWRSTREIGYAWRQSEFTDFRKFLRSQAGDIALQSLLNICSCEREGI